MFSGLKPEPGVCWAQEHGVAAQRGSLSCSKAGAGLGLLRASLMCRQGWGRARAAQCSQIEPSCTQSSWLCAGRALQGVLDKRHCIKDSTDLYSILTELLQSLSKWPKQSQPPRWGARGAAAGSGADLQEFTGRFNSSFIFGSLLVLFQH